MIYSIQDTTLTAIGDALRAKTSETRPVKEEYAVFSYGINSFDEDVISGEATTGLLKRTHYQYPENTAYIIAKCKIYATDGNSYFQIGEDAVNGDYYYGTNEIKEIRVEGNMLGIQIYRRVADTPLGAYCEIRGYDADGNLVLFPSKTETELNGYKPEDMPEVINSLEKPMPEEALTITGNCQSKFAYGGWDWFIRRYGNRLTTSEITNIEYMFYTADPNYGLVNIPFDINLSYNFNGNFKNAFSNRHLKSIPLIKGDIKPAQSNYSGNPDMSSMFQQARMEEMPYDYFSNFGGEEYWSSLKQYNGKRNNMFYSCVNLKELPDLSLLANTATYSTSLYYELAKSCGNLRRVINLPVLENVIHTLNSFNGTVMDCYRLKDFTFATDNGTPKTATCKKQTLDLTTVGYYSGYDAEDEKTIVDDATYQALKDDPDSWTKKIEYSRYNHHSAVATINSLPDTSAYLATAGGTNTIKFKGEAGSLTDGGAINTLTEEEIAVATAKGWTVSFV